MQSNLVLDCIQHLYNAGITVCSVTCDGTEVNERMFRYFGVSMDDPCFDHPSNPEIKIYAVCDVCHMLKLVCNTLGDMKIMLDENKNQIRWSRMLDFLTYKNLHGSRQQTDYLANAYNIKTQNEGEIGSSSFIFFCSRCTCFCDLTVVMSNRMIMRQQLVYPYF